MLRIYNTLTRQKEDFTPIHEGKAYMYSCGPTVYNYAHIGNLRTCLYAYLFARKEGGKFIRRIEDTDRERYVEGAVETIYRTLEKAGIDHDEGPDKDGGCGPYVQSERKSIYMEYAKKLVEQIAVLTAPKARALRDGELRELPVEELVLGWLDAELWNMDEGYVFAIYTLVDGQPVLAVEGWERSLYVVREDNILCHCGSSGAGRTEWRQYRFDPSTEGFLVTRRGVEPLLPP